MDSDRNLLKILAKIAPNDLVHVLETLWKTRSTGLHSSQKKDLQTRLALKSLQELDIVLVRLRSMMRKYRQGDLHDNEIRKILPHDFGTDLQEAFLGFLQSRRIECGDQEQRELEARGLIEIEIRSASMFPNYSSYPCKQDDSPSPSPSTELNFPNIKGNLPHLKSMTWTIENPNLGPSERAAIVCMKLQYSRNPSDEVDLKFRITRDTLEALVRSMTYINDQFQLLNSVRQTDTATDSGIDQVRTDGFDKVL